MSDQPGGGGKTGPDDEQWPRIEAILDRLLELPTAAQEAGLERECGDDAALRTQVEALLRADQLAGGFLAEGAAERFALLVAEVAADPEERESWLGRDVGPYHLRREIGSGGMGEVYEAYHARLERSVALKRVQLGLAGGDATQRERFRREARLAAGLSHPAIVGIHDLLEAEGEDWLVMEYVEGQTLARVLQEGPLPEDRALALARQLAGGLAAAHVRGVIHRDLKPENVVITPEGRAKILDFGLAKEVAPSTAATTGAPEAVALTARHQVLGTLRAMSPEQARGEPLDARSDLFSLGSLLYQAVTGESPFQGSTPAVTLTRVCTHDPPPARTCNPAVSPGLSELIDRLLAKDPDGRPRQAGEVTAALARLADDRRRPWWLWASVAAAVVALALGAAWWWGREAPPPRYVAVIEPELTATAGSESASGADLVVAGVYSAVQEGLADLSGLAALTSAGLDGPPGSALATARALGAAEALTARLDCPLPSCQLTLSRLAAADGRVLWLANLEIPPHDLPLLRTAVISSLRAAFPESRPRSKGTARVSNEGYATYLRLLAAYRGHQEPGGPALVEQIAALRRSEPDFLEALLLEAQVARETFHGSRQPQWLARALELLDEARKKAPGDPRVASYLFDLAGESQDWELAEGALATLTRLEPSSAGTLQRQAELLAHQGEGGRALELSREAARRRPAYALLFNLALMEYQAGQVGAARETLEGLVERAPSYYRAHSLLAQLELLDGSPERAVELFEQLRTQDRDAGTLSNLGTAYLLVNRIDAAAAVFREAYELQPKNAIIVLNLADALTLQLRHEAPPDLYGQVIDLLEQDPGLAAWQELTVRGQALAHLGRAREAVAAVQEAYRLAPDNPQVALESALVYTLVGDYQTALANVERALDMGLAAHWFRLPWFAPLGEFPAFREWLEGASPAVA